MKKILLLGSGELGKELTISLKRMGCYVVACDAYENAPAMQVSDMAEVFNMLDKVKLTEIINKHIENGQLEWFIILGYRITDQFKNLKFNNRERNFILINLPPAFIWHYY